ncbi:phage protein [Clostridia bacterium]|nr:phage protein [Clostridia bacterium]
MKLSFTVPGKPQGKARPRFDGRNKRTYTPESTRAYEEMVRLYYRQAHRNAQIEGEVTAIIVACFPIPKSAKLADKEAMIAGEIKPTIKPDADNIIKAILDALNGLAYHDDAAVVNVTAEKRYSTTPRVEVTITNEGC